MVGHKSSSQNSSVGYPQSREYADDQSDNVVELILKRYSSSRKDPPDTYIFGDRRGYASKYVVDSSFSEIALITFLIQTSFVEEGSTSSKPPEKCHG